MLASRVPSKLSEPLPMIARYLLIVSVLASPEPPELGSDGAAGAAGAGGGGGGGAGAGSAGAGAGAPPPQAGSLAHSPQHMGNWAGPGLMISPHRLPRRLRGMVTPARAVPVRRKKDKVLEQTIVSLRKTVGSELWCYLLPSSTRKAYEFD